MNYFIVNMAMSLYHSSRKSVSKYKLYIIQSELILIRTHIIDWKIVKLHKQLLEESIIRYTR